MNARPALILASTSRYRRELLGRLGLPFECHAPAVDETPWPSETPEQLCRRLSAAKADAIAEACPEAWVIGSDQVAELDGQLIGKPLLRAQSHQQLSAASGRRMRFHTGLSVIQRASGRRALHVEVTDVRFRELSATMIDNYLDREDALDCAGGFKCEGLGISLFAAITADDPTALIGLPLIALRRILGDFGIDPLL